MYMYIFLNCAHMYMNSHTCMYMYTCRRGQVCGRASLQDGQLHGSEMVRCMWSLHVGAGQTRNEVQRSVLKAMSHGTSSPVPSHPKKHSCGKERLVTIKAFIDPVKAISGWGFSARDYGIRDSGIICSPHADQSPCRSAWGLYCTR